MKANTLTRALLYGLACALALGAIAFWPTKRWTTPPRPPLQAPIVFDELQNLPHVSADASGVQQKP